jgi:hypothetical protein
MASITAAKESFIFSEPDRTTTNKMDRTGTKAEALKALRLEAPSEQASVDNKNQSEASLVHTSTFWAPYSESLVIKRQLTSNIMASLQSACSNKVKVYKREEVGSPAAMFLVVLEGMVYTVGAIFAAAALYLLNRWYKGQSVPFMNAFSPEHNQREFEQRPTQRMPITPDEFRT